MRESARLASAARLIYKDYLFMIAGKYITFPFWQKLVTLKYG